MAKQAPKLGGGTATLQIPPNEVLGLWMELSHRPILEKQSLIKEEVGVNTGESDSGGTEKTSWRKG